MSAPPPRLSEDAAPAAALLDHLRACDGQFTPRLSARIDLAGYASRLRARARTFEAWDGLLLVGLVAAYLDAAKGSCFVSNVSVLPGHQRRGLATLLLRRCFDECQGRGIRQVSLEVSAESEGALALYARLGFREAVRRGGQLWMSLGLGDGSGAGGLR